MTVLTPSIFPDEFVIGYRGRLRIQNSYGPHLESLMGLLRDRYYPPGTAKNEAPEIALLAHAGGVPIQDFVRQHSFLPLHRAVAKEHYDADHGEKMILNRKYGTRILDSSLGRFCPECLEEDKKGKGVAYWHRSHQIPGIPWCQKHGSRLLNSPLGNKSFDDLPSLDLSTESDFSEQEFLQVSENSALQRYAEILNGFLDAKKPKCLHDARKRVLKVIEEDQDRRGKKTFTELVEEQIPLFWLRTLYFSLVDSSTGRFAKAVDNFHFALGVELYALALALLFKDSQDALEYWYSGVDDCPESKFRLNYPFP